MELVGITRAEVEEQSTVEVWADNWPAVRAFLFLRTQWHVGAAGATGLNYLVIPMAMEHLGIDPEEKWQITSDLQVMEYEALRLFNREK